MAKLQDIENAVINLNPAAFQDLGDGYLKCLHPEWKLKCRPGSQPGKQKTIKGTPDSVFQLPSGKYVFVQHSTNSTNKVGKMKDDIDKCMNPSNTGIQTYLIDRIILCANFRLSVEQSSLLESDKVEVYSLDSIVQDILLRFPELGWKYLGLEREDSQLIPVEVFVKSYDNSANRLATPLDIPFKHREKTVAETIDLLNACDIVILNGSAGTGKTKLAIEVCRQLGNDMDCYAFNSKNLPSIRELEWLKNAPAPVLLFVDDVNRVSENQVNLLLEGFLHKEGPKRKLLLTVRDYSKDEINSLLSSYRFGSVTVHGFSDDEIKAIIQDEPFQIVNTSYQEMILRIADGNPRLAIMASQLALEKQSLSALHNVSDLFALYYSRVTKEVPFVSDDSCVRILGLLGFFHHIDFSEEERLSLLLAAFNLSKDVFLDTCVRLNEKELVDIQYNVVRISEQNLGIYFFWKAFFEKELLSFDVLLENYFPSMIHRFRDTMNPITNMYGYSALKEKVERPLSEYADSKDDSILRDFYGLFYYFLPEKTLHYVWGQISDLPEKPENHYQTDYNDNDYSFDSHNDLHLLGLICRSNLDYIKEAVDLSFEIVRRKPEEMPRLLYEIKTAFCVSLEDGRTDYIRQKILVDYITGRMRSGDTVALNSFPRIAEELLRCSFQNVVGGRGNSVTFYTVSLPLTSGVKHIRETVWRGMNILSPEVICRVLLKYYGVDKMNASDVISFDLNFMTGLINDRLSPSVFLHCFCVHKLKKRLARLKVSSRNFNRVAKRFTNDVFQMYLILVGGNDYPEGHNWERKVRQSFVIRDVKEQEKFVANYKTVSKALDSQESYRFNEALDYVVDESMTKCFSRGVSLMRALMLDNEVCYYPFVPFRNHLSTRYKINHIWDTIISVGAGVRVKLNYFSCLPSDCATRIWGNRFYETVKECTPPVILCHTRYLSILSRHPYLTEIIFKYVVDSRLPILDDDWIGFGLDSSVPVDLLEECYLLSRQKSYYDYDRTALLRLVRKDKGFLLRFLASYGYNEQMPHLGMLWSLEDKDLMLETFNYLIDNNWEPFNGMYEHLFEDIPPEQRKMATTFLLSFIAENYLDEQKMNAVVDVVDAQMPEMRRLAVRTFLSKTTSPELFDAVNWTKTHSVVYCGNVNPGEEDVKRWERLLDDVNTSGLGACLIPIRESIKRHISKCSGTIDYFKKRDFMERD